MKHPYLIFTFLSTFLLASCLPTQSSQSSLSSTTSQSEPSSSQGPLKVSQMMATMEAQNYTLDLSINGTLMYAYDVDLPLLHVFIEVEGNMVEAYLDLTDENLVYLYTQDPSIGEGWIKQPADPFSLFFVLAPLSFLNLSIMQDDWFTYDEVSMTYSLDMVHIQTIVGEETETEGLESLTIQGDASSITITLDGFNPETEEPQTLVFEYGSIGTTVVTLPTDLLDVAKLILEDLILESDNHSYYLSVTKDDPSFSYERIGYRDGATFATETYVSNDETTLFEERYYDDTGLEIIKNDDGFSSSYVDTITYDQALSDFYPVAFHTLQYDWLEPTGNTNAFGDRIFTVDAAHNDGWLHLEVLFPTSEIQRVEVVISDSLFTGPFIAVDIDFMIGMDTYQLTLEAEYFGQTYVEMPTEEDDFHLAQAIPTLASSTNYRLNQSLINNETFEYDQDALISRDGNHASIRYEIFDFDVYYEQIGETYREYRFDTTVNDYVQSDVDASVFQTAVLDAHWMRHEALTAAMVEPMTFAPDNGTIDPEAYASTLFSSDFLLRFEVLEITVFSESFEGEKSIYFFLTLEEKATTISYDANVIYSEINTATISFPTEGVV